MTDKPITRWAFVVKFARPCPECGSDHVQLLDPMPATTRWRCRRCEYKWEQEVA
jgi:transposase-like protein